MEAGEGAVAGMKRKRSNPENEENKESNEIQNEGKDGKTTAENGKDVLKLKEIAEGKEENSGKLELQEAADEDSSEEEEEEEEEESEEGHEQAGEKEDNKTKSSEKSSDDSWFYVDDQEKLQGPFTLFQMQSWWFAGMLPNDLLVKKKHQRELTVISSLPEFSWEIYQAQQQQQQQQYEQYYAQASSYAYPYGQMPASSNYGQATFYPSVPMQPIIDTQSDEDARIAAKLLGQEYTQTAAFNIRTGRFQANQRAWDDPAGRQMAHYFDPEAWQRQCQAQGKKKKIKVPKKYTRKYRLAHPKKKKIPQYLLGD
jgi:hypothetical protein